MQTSYTFVIREKNIGTLKKYSANIIMQFIRWRHRKAFKCWLLVTWWCFLYKYFNFIANVYI